MVFFLSACQDPNKTMPLVGSRSRASLSQGLRPRIRLFQRPVSMYQEDKAKASVEHEKVQVCNLDGESGE